MTLIVGTREDAMLAVSGIGEEIGRGSRRTAYLINGIVYKVGYARAQYSEYENYLKWSVEGVMPANVFLPDTYLWNVGNVPVIAMQYIVAGDDNDDDDLVDEYCDAIVPISADVWHANVILNDEGCWLIDMEW